MKNILCFGDSNTYGMHPRWMIDGFKRHPRNVRWPGRMQELLGDEYHVIEEGLNGRTTVFDTPTDPHRSGIEFLPVALDTHYPLDCVIIMLGTNDIAPLNGYSVLQSAKGLEMLVKCVLNPYAYPYNDPPKIVIASPVPLRHIEGDDGFTAEDVVAKSLALADAYRPIAERYGCTFVDLAKVATASEEDGAHLSAEAHESIAHVMADAVRKTV